jgi:phosphoserine aminotransferase
MNGPRLKGHAMTTTTATERALNFSAGPGVLPEEVLRQVQADIWDIGGTGIGIMEHSHRAATYDRIIAEAIADCKTVGNIGDDYEVLFMTGGASAQNYLIPANLLPEGGTADYANTGYWAKKTAQECQYYGTAHIAFEGKPHNYKFIPSQSELRFSANPAYFHYTSNNTIMGTQFHYVPETPAGVPLVCDMCSDIFSAPVDVSKFGLIYAGAQKNLGPAGTTVVIVRKDLLERAPRALPTMLRYKSFADNESRPNTPPVFAIYMVGLVFKWIQRQGGLAPIAARNAAKAKIIYDAIDATGFYKGHAREDSRSLMNISFHTPTPELDKAFLAEAGKEGMDNLKGHRSIGGLRASVYNAFPTEGCETLAQFMREFARRHG